MSQEIVDRLWSSLIACQPCTFDNWYTYMGRVSRDRGRISRETAALYVQKWKNANIIDRHGDGKYFVCGESSVSVHLLERVEYLEMYMNQMMPCIFYMSREHTEQLLLKHMDKNLVAIVMTYVPL
jgi:hypothetical protein